MSTRLLPLLSTAIVVTAITTFAFAAFGIPQARTLALLIGAQMSTIISMGLFSNEVGVFTAPSLALTLAALAVQGLPDRVPQSISMFASLTVGTLSYLLLVRHPRLPLGSIAGRLVVVTGSSAGIGLETARQLLALGATVVFACRTEQRARAAMRVALSGADEIAPGVATADRAIFVPLDLSSCASVVACAARVREIAKELASPGTPGALHALVCNAGAFSSERALTADGFERNFGANFLTHALLIELLLPLLRERAGGDQHHGGEGGGRVVSVSSSMHKTASVAELLADPMSERSYGVFPAYAKSKLAQVVHTTEMQRREDARPAGSATGGSARRTRAATREGGGDARVTFICCHPGNAQTEVTRDFPWIVHKAYLASQPLMRTAQATTMDAASTSVFAVAAAEPALLSGAYLERSTPVPPLAEARDEVAGRELHELTQRLLKPWLGRRERLADRD
jgi:NAD(P)-dependent dehydrogenase (short-subunit alcohol dehydrogenase family)